MFAWGDYKLIIKLVNSFKLIKYIKLYVSQKDIMKNYYE